MHYPNAAKTAGIEGKVIVQAFVDIKGRVTETVILKDIPNSGFGKAASAAIQRTRFNPAKRRGKPVAAWTTIPVRFILKNSLGLFRQPLTSVAVVTKRLPAHLDPSCRCHCPDFIISVATNKRRSVLHITSDHNSMPTGEIS